MCQLATIEYPICQFSGNVKQTDTLFSSANLAEVYCCSSIKKKKKQLKKLYGAANHC